MFHDYFQNVLGSTLVRTYTILIRAVASQFFTFFHFLEWIYIVFYLFCLFFKICVMLKHEAVPHRIVLEVCDMSLLHAYILGFNICPNMNFTIIQTQNVNLWLYFNLFLQYCWKSRLQHSYFVSWEYSLLGKFIWLLRVWPHGSNQSSN